MTTALIIGFGRAGQRHAKILETFDINWAAVDPAIYDQDIDAQVVYTNLDTALKDPYDFAVIATPPDLHLEQLRLCLNAGLPVLCEKPLCGWGQLTQARQLRAHGNADRVMMAYNYRFHPTLMQVRRTNEAWLGRNARIDLFSNQCRPDVPEWGLMLDHVSHSLDILSWLVDGQLVDVEGGSWEKADEWEAIGLWGRVGYSRPFSITERVTKKPVDKLAFVEGPFGKVEVDTSPEVATTMFNNMWQVFLRHLTDGEPFPVGLEAGIRTQELLERGRAICGRDK